MEKTKLGQYLDRINYQGNLTVSEETLREIHFQHSETIPFENLEAISGGLPSLNCEDIFSKIVIKNRGGWCFEQNILLLNVLSTLGFKCWPSMSRVLFKGNERGIRTHFMGYVELGEHLHIIDVGFGALSPRRPLSLDQKRIETQEARAYRIKQKKLFGRVLQSKIEGTWEDLYTLDNQGTFPSDLAMANFWASKSKECIFCNVPVVELKKRGKEYKIFGRNFIGPEEKYLIKSEFQLGTILKSYFQIKLGPEDLRKVFQKSRIKFTLPQREWAWRNSLKTQGGRVAYSVV